MTHADVLQVFRDTGALLEGHFVLRSGLHSRQYFQCALALQQMPIVERLGGALADKVAETSPEQPEGHYLRAEVAFAREDFVKALEYYGQAEACAAESTYYLVFNDHFTRLELLARRGLCQQRLGLTQEARQTGEALLRLAPEHPLGKMLGNPPGPGTP